jgi:subtilisin family serine protease
MSSLSRRIIIGATLVGFSVLALFNVFIPPSTANGVATVIVQLSSEPVVVAKYRAETEGRSFDVNTYRQQIIAEQDNFLNRAAASGVNYVVSGVSAPNGEVTANIQFRFNYVYNGVTLEVPEAAIPLLKGLEGVANVYKAEQMYAHLDHAVSYTRASQLYGQPARLTQFDQAATGGMHGEGMIVAVIDTGIDWAHPMFGGDPTPPQFGVGPALASSNRKVIYYLNLTAAVAGDDFGHGTHVAGDIAGFLGRAPGKDMVPMTADDVNVHGVAPQARLMGYKTLTAAGAGLNPSTIMALEDAVQPFTIAGLPKPVPHIINLSLGSTTNDPDFPTSVACDNATLAGVTVVASAGNSGRPTETNPTGEATIGSPGTGRRVLTVGANNDPGPPADDIVFDRVTDGGRPFDRTDVLDPAGINRSVSGLVDGTDKTIAAGERADIPVKLSGGSPALGNIVAQYYVFAGTVTTPVDVPDSVAGRIAIARVSGTYAQVANFLAAKGASAGILIFDGTVTVVNSTIPTWSIGEADARYLLDLLASNDAPGVDPVKGTLSEFPLRIKPGSFTPAMADFSSKGPVTGFGQVKPDVTAPGVAILSSTVRAGGVATSGAVMMNPTGYISASGTSFSSPITAGVAALVKQRHPTWTPAMIRAALINTATNLRFANGIPEADGVQGLNNQGGGLIDAFAAASTTALMGSGSPGPSGGPPAMRPFQIGVSPLAGTSPGNPDFSASYSFGQVPIAGVEGTATLTQAVNILDVANGDGAGTYYLSADNVRAVDGSSVQVTTTDSVGNAITSVTVPANGSASFNVTVVVNGASIANPTEIQWYLTANRNDGGQRLRMPFYYRAIAPTVTTSTAVLNNLSGTEVSGEPPVDINGSYAIHFSSAGSGSEPAKFRVQESSDGGTTWTTLADLDHSQAAYEISERGNGNYAYCVRGLFAVQYGVVEGPASNSATVQVDRRVEADVTSMIQSALSNVTFSAGAFEFDQTLRNKSVSTKVYPPLRFRIVSVQSSSGTVSVSNADNGGDGVSTAAEFDYSNTFGFDLLPGEVSSARRLRFSDPAAELFTFTAVVIAHLPDSSAGGSSSGSSAPSAGTSGSEGSSAGGSSSARGSGGAQSMPNVGGLAVRLTFAVNPLTRSIRLN